MKKMVVVLPRGESIKNFVYSGITDKLREQYTIVFYSVVPNEEIKKYLVEKSDAFYELPETPSKNTYAEEINKVLQIAHLYTLNAVTGNLKILKDDLLSKKSLKNRIVRVFRKQLAKFFTSQKSLARLTSYFIKSNFKNTNVLELEKKLLEINPDIVFNTSHIHNALSLDLMYAAKKIGIKTAAFLFSWDNLTSQGRILPDYDYYFTWNPKIKNDLLNYYPLVSKSNVFVTGTSQFDFHFNKDFILSKEKLYDFLGIPLHKKIVLYSTGMPYYNPKEYIVAEEVAKTLKKIDPDLQLVIRIYAKDDNLDYYKLREENKDIIIPDHFWELNHLTPTLKDIELFNSLLNHCVIGINVASTVSLDLAILEKPVINIAFNPPGEDIYPNDYSKIYDFDHYKPIIESGAISLSKTVNELEEHLRAYLENPKLHSDKREALVDNFFGKELKMDKAKIFSEVFEKIV